MILPTSYKMKPPPTARLLRGHPLARGLIACWLMSERGGHIIQDGSGYRNTGTLVDDTHFVQGKFGSALNFDGAGDYVNCGDVPQVEGLTAFTVSHWASVPTDTIAQTEWVLSKRGNNNPDRTFGVYVNDSENVLLYVYTSDGNAVCWFPDAFLNVAHVFKHVVGVYDGTNISLFVNGIAGTSSALTGTTNNSTAPLVMGAENVAAQGPWPGKIDHVMLWNRALSVSEFTQLYHEPFCMFRRKGNLVGFQTGVVPPAALPQFASLTSQLWWLKHNQGMYSEL